MIDNNKHRIELIEQVRSIGKSLIENAESIVGTEKMLTRLHISATCSVVPTDVFIPEIDIDKSFLPEKYVYYSMEQNNGHSKNS